MKVIKVKGINNIADILTKHVERECLHKHVSQMDMVTRQDRHELNPEVATDNGGT